MGSKYSKKRQGYDIDKANKGSGAKKTGRSRKLHRRWKSVDVFTQTGEDDKTVAEIKPRVKAAASMDDLRDADLDLDNKTKEPLNGRNKVYTSSSDDISDVSHDKTKKKKKKKKKKLKKSKDKMNKNNDNEKKKIDKKSLKDDMDSAVVINVSDVSDVEESARHSAIMVTNPVYLSADLPSEHQIKPSSSSSSSDDEKESKQPNGDDLANEILEVVSSAQLIHDIEESIEIENLPEPPPIPQRIEEHYHEEYESLEKVQYVIQKPKVPRSRSSSSSSSSDEEPPKVEKPFLSTTNDIDLNDVEIVYENAILKPSNDGPITVPYTKVAPIAEPESFEELSNSEPDLVTEVRKPDPEFVEVRKISRSHSSSSSSSSSEKDKEIVIVPVPEVRDPFAEVEEPPKDPVFEDVLIATAISEDPEPIELPNETESLVIQKVIVDDQPPEIPAKPKRLMRKVSSSSSSSSSADEGELVIPEKVLPPPPPPPPIDDDPPEAVVEMADAIAQAIVLDTMENIKVEAVLLAPTDPEPLGKTQEIELPIEEPVVSLPEPEPKPEPEPEIVYPISRKRSTTSSSSSSLSSSDDD